MGVTMETLCIHPFIHSSYLCSASSSPSLIRGASDSAWILCQFHAEAPQASAREGLVQGPYMAARVRFEPMTIRMKDNESTN